ncbi:hypothetical protein F4775DRAFT_38983 [Biscogniauxia sp. FL1348]|nr:hypothetical protein F4775DRAFT_38983 [Biscogniauxia sp. FL1348]
MVDLITSCYYKFFSGWYLLICIHYLCMTTLIRSVSGTWSFSSPRLDLYVCVCLGFSCSCIAEKKKGKLCRLISWPKKNVIKKSKRALLRKPFLVFSKMQS